MFKPFQTTLHYIQLCVEVKKKWCLKKTRNGKKAKMKNGKKRNGSRPKKIVFFNFFLFYVDFVIIFTCFFRSMFITYKLTSYFEFT